MATVIDLYELKVRQIALLQCRCQTGADLECDRPKIHRDEEPEPPKAA